MVNRCIEYDVADMPTEVDLPLKGNYRKSQIAVATAPSGLHYCCSTLQYFILSPCWPYQGFF